ncbi:MAG TPA: hypothetical protein V6C81_21905 [Planktothrix sp.]
MAELYRFNQQIFAVPAGDGSDLIHCDITGATKIVPSHESRFLKSCVKFATIDEHALRICEEFALGAMHVQSIVLLLNKYAEAGLLVPKSLLLEKCKGGDGTPARIEYLCIPTFNRPQYLHDCALSYAECAREFGRKIVIVVADQSNAENLPDNIAALESIKQEFPDQEIRHIDQNAARAYAICLAKESGIAQSLIEYSITKQSNSAFGGGANRNLLLLATAGAMSLQADDDGLCRVMQNPESSPGLILSAKVDPVDYWYLTAEETAQMEETFMLHDIFALHEQFLGKTLAQCVRENGGDADVENSTVGFLRRANPIDQRIVVSNVGVAGESGRRGNAPYIVIEGEKRERLTKSHEHYRHVQVNQQMFCGARTATISQGCICFGFNLALDGRYLVPPFIPIMRGEDSAFTPIFRTGVSGGLMAVVPWLARHRGAGKKHRPQDIEPEDASRLVFSDVLGLLLQNYHMRSFAQDPSFRMAALGRTLSDLGHLPLEDFREMLAKLWWPAASHQIRLLDKSLKQYSHKPDFWATDIKAYRHALQESLTNPRSIIAKDVIAAFGDDEAPAKQQELVHEFGEILKIWPQLKKSAAELRMRQGECGRRIGNSQTVK